jgi:Domain of unknown function (DUF1905)/Bacteriocin-protection, YdeI or OmpD-Associated
VTGKVQELYSAYFDMIRFVATILKFAKKGEKTGWSYIEISAKQANQLKPNTKVSFRVKGLLDTFAIKQKSLIPMGDGKFILPINGTMRKAIGKEVGERVTVRMELDESKFILSPDMMACLKDEPASMKFFKSLPGAHQKYFSNWVESAKTPETKAKRIASAMNAFSRQQGFGEMIRSMRSN